jgi:hypothetical protein
MNRPPCDYLRMIILQKIDYEGSNFKKDIEKLNKVHDKIRKQLKSGKIEGPYFPQDASVLYIFEVDEYEWLNRAGRLWYKEMSKEELPFVPKSYEIAVTPKEFFG